MTRRPCSKVAMHSLHGQNLFRPQYFILHPSLFISTKILLAHSRGKCPAVKMKSHVFFLVLALALCGSVLAQNDTTNPPPTTPAAAAPTTNSTTTTTTAAATTTRTTNPVPTTTTTTTVPITNTTTTPVPTTSTTTTTTTTPVPTASTTTTTTTTPVPTTSTTTTTTTTPVPSASTTTTTTTTPVPTTSTTTTTITSAPPKVQTTTGASSTVAPPQNLEQPEEKVVLGPEVSVAAGRLKPLVLKSRSGRDYYAFRGVPFANPPVTAFRFKRAAPVSQWDGVLNATRFREPCVQYNLLIDAIEGEEDCLYLNVFTPKLAKDGGDKKYPVIVFIHQGAFMFGASRDYEAKYLMDEDVVLVTIAYRLGAFGFLNTEGGGSDVHGNMGLKDQVLALQWIQDNIHVFNGEKNLVTIMGESAGGASVHYHLLSEHSKGLFSRAISMSGTALSPWAFVRTPRRNAKKLATMLNCPTTSMYELYVCLNSVPAHTIAQKQKEFFEWGTDPIAPFGPSVEVDSDDTTYFMRETPYTLMAKGKINDAAPWMLGVTQDVCLLDAWSILVDPQLVEDMNVDWHRIAPLAYSFSDTALEPDAISNQIRAFYFGSETIGNSTAQNLTRLYSDRWFNHGTRTSAVLHGKMNEAVPIFLYLFAYQGQQTHLKFLGINEKLGVSEGDELQYIFNMKRFEEIPRRSEDEAFSKKVIKLLVSFAAEGKPSESWSESKWNRMSLEEVKGNEALMFYKLDANCSAVEEPFVSRMSFWDNLPLNEMDHELENPYARKNMDDEQDDNPFES